MKGRKLLPIAIIICYLRPISLPGDRPRTFPTSPFQRSSLVLHFILLFTIVLALLAIRSLADFNVAYISYYNDFIEPSHILGKNWNRMTVVAQQSIMQWADWLAAQGPWCTRIPPLSKSSSLDVGELTFWEYCPAVTTSKHFSCALQRYPRLSQLGTIVRLSTPFIDAECSLGIY